MLYYHEGWQTVQEKPLIDLEDENLISTVKFGEFFVMVWGFISSKGVSVIRILDEILSKEVYLNIVKFLPFKNIYMCMSSLIPTNIKINMCSVSLKLHCLHKLTCPCSYAYEQKLQQKTFFRYSYLLTTFMQALVIFAFAYLSFPSCLLLLV